MKRICVIGVTAILLVGFNSCNNRSTSQMQENQICDNTHNAKNSLDWNGIYKGLIPCADCEGIDVQITLNTDETYQISYLYLGKSSSPFLSSGKFVWDENGSIITLESDSLGHYYLVGENKLTQLDNDKKIIEGQHASMYVLIKQ